MAAFSIFSACNQKSAIASSSPGDKPLEQTTWKLVALTSLAGSFPQLPKDVTMRMQDGRINGFAGCNTYFGGYTSKLNYVQFTGVGSTRMFCQQGMDVENGLFQVFTNTSNYRISGSHLELMKSDAVLAKFEALSGK